MHRLLIIGYVWPEPRSSAAGSRMMQLIRLFQRAGYEITFSTPAATGEHHEDLAAMGVSTQSVALNCSSFDHFVKELMPDVVLFDRFMMEEQFGWRVAEQCPNALRILDTEDLHSLRLARHKALKAGREMTKADLFSSEAKREVAAILRSDLSLMISRYEMELLQTTFQVDAALLYHLPFLLETR